MAVSGRAVSLSVSMPVVERFVVERTCWLTGGDGVSPDQTYGRTSDILSSWFAIPALLPQIAGWETAAWKGPLQKAKGPPFTNIFL